uniref:Uncharacterized protein n=1 Tax=Arion vulgaris TaxID=1028688 RepID=A0A0B6ZY87_9EUPU
MIIQVFDREKKMNKLDFLVVDKLKSSRETHTQQTATRSNIVKCYIHTYT